VGSFNEPIEIFHFEKLEAEALGIIRTWEAKYNKTTD